MPLVFRFLVFTVVASLSFAPMRGDADTIVWQDVTTGVALARAGGEPIYYRPLRADTAVLRGQLDAAPREFTASHGAILSLPMPDGSFQRFEVMESPIMAPALAARYPRIRTYRGVGIDDPSATARLDMTPRGFHAMVTGASGTVFIDPEAGGDYYRSFNKRDYGRAVARGEGERMVCQVQDTGDHAHEYHERRETVLARTGSQLRTYRLAVAATGEYTAFHGGTVSNTLAAIVTAINRVNQIYGRDLAIGFVLVADNDAVIYTDAASDPYDNTDASVIMAQNQVNLDTVIGTANYDIGHVFSTGSGGLAGLGAACNDGFKAAGTTGLAHPVGDPFYIDYVAHEIGHQLGARHTFNGTTSNCVAPNRSAATAYEPGSGSTIMAYAGLCGDEDLQSNTDATFHAGSIEEILAYIATGGSCYSVSATGNNPPDVDAGPDYTIPCGTAFVLNGSATDPDVGDSLTFQWDQMDAGTATDSTTYGTDLGDNALFRSFLPRENTYRHFPRLINQLANRSDKAEALPTTSRTVNFRLTVRDGNKGVAEDDMQVVVDNNAGPFTITSLSPASATYNAFDAVTITWDVAESDAAAVNCAFVNIELLTFNAGKTSYCTHTLATNTANDGSQQITIPALANANARFRVMCRDNIFYDITDSDLTINAATAASTNCVSVDAIGGESADTARTISCRANSGGGSVGDGSSDGGDDGGGGGGALTPWWLVLLTLSLSLRYWFNARRSA